MTEIIYEIAKYIIIVIISWILINTGLLLHLRVKNYGEPHTIIIKIDPHVEMLNKALEEIIALCDKADPITSTSFTIAAIVRKVKEKQWRI